MRTVVAFILLMAALMGIGLASASVFLAPPKDLFLPPPDGGCHIPSRTSSDRMMYPVDPRPSAAEA